MKHILSCEDFRTLASISGSCLSRWPQEFQDAARRRLELSPELQSVLDAEQELDQLLEDCGAFPRAAFAGASANAARNNFTSSGAGSSGTGDSAGRLDGHGLDGDGLDGDGLDGDGLDASAARVARRVMAALPPQVALRPQDTCQAQDALTQETCQPASQQERSSTGEEAPGTGAKAAGGPAGHGGAVILDFAQAREKAGATGKEASRTGSFRARFFHAGASRAVFSRENRTGAIPLPSWGLVATVLLGIFLGATGGYFGNHLAASPVQQQASAVSRTLTPLQSYLVEDGRSALFQWVD